MQNGKTQTSKKRNNVGKRSRHTSRDNKKQLASNRDIYLINYQKGQKIQLIQGKEGGDGM